MNQPSAFTKVEYWEIDYFELEKLIIEQYGLKDFDFVVVVECNNDSEHSYIVQKEQTPTMLGHIDKTIKALKSENWSNVWFTDILYDLCNRDVILPGNYLVKVSW